MRIVHTPRSAVATLEHLESASFRRLGPLFGSLAFAIAVTLLTIPARSEIMTEAKPPVNAAAPRGVAQSVADPLSSSKAAVSSEVTIRSAPGAIADTAGCQNVTLNPNGTPLPLRICGQSNEGIQIQGSVIALGGASQTLSVFSDALTSLSVKDDQGTAHPVDTSGGAHVTWQPSTFFSRLDFESGTSRASLFAFTFGALMPQGIDLTGLDPSNGSFKSARLRFGLPVPDLGSIQIEPTLTPSLEPALNTPISLVASGSSQGYLGLVLSTLITKSINLNSGSLGIRTDVTLPTQFGRGGLG